MYYVVKEEAQEVKEYYQEHGEFPPGLSRSQKRYLKQKWEHKYHESFTELPGIAAYTGKPCVYVRWSEKYMAFYVGRSQSLWHRYRANVLQEIIYFEEYETQEETIHREAELIEEFFATNLPILNRCAGAFARDRIVRGEKYVSK